jgi:hypothetical protein
MNASASALGTREADAIGPSSTRGEGTATAAGATLRTRRGSAAIATALLRSFVSVTPPEADRREICCRGR